MNAKKRLPALLLAIIMLLALCAGCGDGSTDAPVGNDGEPKVLRIGAESELTTINPAEGLDLVGSGSTIHGEIYESLFTRDADRNIVGLLAKEFEWKDDNTLVLTLNEGIKFHNGNTFTAEDVLFSLGLYSTNANYFAERLASLDMANSYAEGDYTVVLKTTGYSTVLESALASYQVVMLDKEWYESNSGNIDRIANGTGPYIFKEWETGVGIYMTRNEDYWGGDVGYYDEVKVMFFSDPTTAVMEYKVGTLDIVYVQNAVDIESLIKGEWENTQSVDVARHKLYTLSMCRTIGEDFLDPTLCEAICYAIPVEELVEGALNNTCKPQDSIIPQSDANYTSIGYYEYNPERARELVEEYKAANGLDEVTLTMVNVQSAIFDALGEAVQAYLNEVGINMILDIGQGSQVIPRYMAGEVNFALSSTGGGFDTADAFTALQRGSSPLGMLPSDEVLDLIEEAKVTKDPAARSAMYAEIQQIVHDEFLCLPLAEGCFYYAVRDGITMELGSMYFPVCVDIYEN